MIRGIGTDIIEISRIEKAILKNKEFVNKLFTEDEIRYFEKRNNRSEVIAGNFAAKEAISKALGTGIRGFSMKDIQILRDGLGKPYVEVSETVKGMFDLLNTKIHISISHDRSSAIAYAVVEE